LSFFDTGATGVGDSDAEDGFDSDVVSSVIFAPPVGCCLRIAEALLTAPQ
jgi:hypothetical protein